MFSVENTNKQKSTKSQRSESSFWVLDVLQECCYLTVEDDLKHPFATYLQHLRFSWSSPADSAVFMPLCLSGCAGAWAFTGLLLLGQAEATTEYEDLKHVKQTCH